ncbi:MAG TPA: ATP-dependent DNA helicase [Streptosporangiaceae bacterium]
MRARPSAPVLDDRQRQVVEHPGGPLLVLAGPGTGKTTTIVEAVVDRIERRGVDPEKILVLTFSRKAAEELRERIAGRLGATLRHPLALTFHSYAFALVRREYARSGELPPRLMSGPEQLHEVRELLAGEAHDNAAAWPEPLRPALATRGFADELRALLSRAAERGLGPADLARLGRAHGRDDWVAAGGFLRRYDARFVLDPVPAHDYSELVQVAGGMLADPEIRARQRSEHEVVFVDEYQDTDPAQEALLRALAGDGRDLIAVGDPDQSIYGFRGTDVRNILQFPSRFPAAGGRDAPIVALRTCRRSGAVLLEATRGVARRLPAVPGAGHHRNLDAVDGTEPGEIRKLIAATATQEAGLVADVLRRAHLLDGVPWSRMAVLVRSAARQVPVVRRALIAAGVPVVVAGDETPLKDERGVVPLLALLKAAVRPGEITEESASDLLTGPVGGSDALGLRRLVRALREIDQAAGHRGGTPLADALRDPRVLALVSAEVREPVDRIVAVLEAARGRAAEGGTAEDVLWTIWQSSGLADRWPSTSSAGGTRGAAADRDLDAVVALFDAVARFVDRLPYAGPEVFLETLDGQEIPGDSLAEQAPTGDAVRILTAHRSKGLEWDVVIVAGLQEGVWPDLRLRGSLLGADDLVDASAGVATGPEAITSKLLDEERRLFYVACTRAKRKLILTAVGGDDAEERPSRFLTELAPKTEPELAADGLRWLALPALVADLRSVVTDPARPEPLRRTAAARLARLAAAGVRGAHPDEWYALTRTSDDRPVVTDDEIVRVSPSQVEQFTKCGLRWLLEAAVGARRPDVVNQLGSVIHAVAALAATDDALDETALGRKLDEIWSELDFGGRWYGEKQRQVADEMVRKFLAWHRTNPRKLVAVEEGFAATVGQVRITGRVDRVESDDDGRGVVVDLKTGASMPKADDLDRHPQLGVYQLAVLLNAFEKHGLVEPGGAELVQVGKKALKAEVRIQRQRPLGDDDDPKWAERLVDTVARGMSGAVFEARVNDGCRTCPVASCCPVHEKGAHVTD